MPSCGHSRAETRDGPPCVKSCLIYISENKILKVDWTSAEMVCLVGCDTVPRNNTRTLPNESGLRRIKNKASFEASFEQSFGKPPKPGASENPDEADDADSANVYWKNVYPAFTRHSCSMSGSLTVRTETRHPYVW